MEHKWSKLAIIQHPTINCKSIENKILVMDLTSVFPNLTKLYLILTKVESPELIGRASQVSVASIEEHSPAVHKGRVSPPSPWHRNPFLRPHFTPAVHL